MKYVDQPVKMQKEIMKKTLYLGSLPVLYCLISGKMEIMLGLILGIVISILLLRLKFLHIRRAVDMKEEKANSFIRNRYLIQYLIYFVVLITAFRNPSVNFLAAAAGLFLMKVTVLIWVIIDLIKSSPEQRLDIYDEI